MAPGTVPFRILVAVSMHVVNLVNSGTLPSTLPHRQNTSSVTSPTSSAATITSFSPAGYVNLDAVMWNVTRSRGETVRIRCEITGFPLPRYQWLHNGKSLLHSTESPGGKVDQRFEAKTTHWGSRLKIENLQQSDAGSYTCEGFNEFGQQATIGFLTVIQHAATAGDHIHVGGLLSRTAATRDRSTPPAQAFPAGSSPPHQDSYEYYEDEDDVDEYQPLHDVISDGLLPHHIDRINIHDVDDVILSDDSRRPGIQGQPQADSPENRRKKHRTSTGNKSGARSSTGSSHQPTGHRAVNVGSCELYTGSVCPRDVGHVFVARADSQLSVEHQLSATMSLLATSGEYRRNNCADFVRPLLCRYAFPSCTVANDDVTDRKSITGDVDVRHLATESLESSRRNRNRAEQRNVVRLCREDCEELERNVCTEPFQMIRRMYSSDDGRLVMLNCGVLPSGEEAGTDCVRLLPSLRQQLHKTTQTLLQGDEFSTTVYYIVIPSVVSPLSVCLLIFLICLCRRDNRCTSTTSSDKSAAPRSDVTRGVTPPSTVQFRLRTPPSATHCAGAGSGNGIGRRGVKFRQPDGATSCSDDDELDAMLPGTLAPSLRFTPNHRTYNFPEVTEIGSPADGVQLVRLLGAGVYGTLYIGRWLDAETDRQTGNSNHVTAFVKLLLDTPGAEVDRLLQINHENLVRLIAVVGGGGVVPSTVQRHPVCLVYEYVDNCVDLQQYLVTQQQRHDVENPRQQLWRCRVAVQVARALDYLSSIGLVHRDVAARNVIVSSSPQHADNPPAKLSDFSLSVHPYSSDYVQPGASVDDSSSCQSPLPLRWLSPEALFASRYSEASDSWAFGVLLWEIYCGRGLIRPYDWLADVELVEVLATPSVRPSLPGPCVPGCPSTVYSLMSDCWRQQPTRRPRFVSIVDRLSAVELISASGMSPSTSTAPRSDDEGCCSGSGASPAGSGSTVVTGLGSVSCSCSPMVARACRGAGTLTRTQGAPAVPPGWPSSSPGPADRRQFNQQVTFSPALGQHQTFCGRHTVMH